MILLALIILSLFCGTTEAQTGPGAQCLCLEELEAAQGMANPMVIEHANDNSGRLFASDQNGLVWGFASDGSRITPPFINLTANVHVSFDCGLYSFTFHPDFANNGRVYVWYCIGEQGTASMRLSELSVSESNPDVTDPASERVLLEVYYGVYEHNGGAFMFGPDGYLYFGCGDGDCCGDPAQNAQNKGTYPGAVHRIDVDSRTGNLEYGIPPDNPFLDDPEALPELYAYGFRQPYKATMDKGDRDTGYGYGRIFIGEVGDQMWEEVDILYPGGNYGWSGREGPECYNMTLCGNTEPEVWPIIYYNRTIGWCVIGGSVYRGCANPDLNGWYMFGDHTFGELFGMWESAQDEWEWKKMDMCTTCPDGQTNTFPQYIIGFGENEQGEIYFSATEIPTPFDPLARIYKIIDPNNHQPPCGAK